MVQRFKIGVGVVMCLFVLVTILTAFPFSRAQAQGRGGPSPSDVSVTTSARGVILGNEGETRTSVLLTAPTCSGSTEFLVTDIYVGPEVLGGNTTRDVVQLTNWAVSVPVYQFYSEGDLGGAIQVALTALGDGPEAVSARIPAGQRILESPIPVTILMLGASPAAQRFEFNVHLTGFCGAGFTL